ncbi:Phd finger-like protein [Thalictrum thalictroides]|uniref:Phd finger-like protein n=1 Tax=Thalictrum thalictroides TaxID=46969 RepID=A0A7J6V4K7_THATH|nr:Phd finger-like protein [Thalictrum thalictroides]
MEEGNNMCGSNHLDADARLPPRKRLLAGLKKQNCDCSSPSSPISSSLLTISSDMSNRLRDLLNANCNHSNHSADEIVEASRLAAITATKVAAEARAVAEEKAAVAAKAAAAARSALELVASFSVKKSRTRKDKLKKHVPVKVLYKKRKRGNKDETDEELARKLHRVMNSSPRITKSSSDQKVNNHKKHRKRLNFEKPMASNGGLSLEGKPPSTCNMNAEVGGVIQGENIVELDDDASECTKSDSVPMDSLHTNGEAEAGYSMVQEDTVSTGRKRGRIKQKKLPLSLCTVRDREIVKEPKSKRLQSVKEPKAKSSTTDDSLLTVEPSTSADASIPTWQKKEFSAPQCYAESNIMRTLCSNPTVTTGSTM